MTDQLSPHTPLTPAHATVADPVPATEATPPVGLKKGSKVRSAWIGFAGRVTAQLIGAIATVGLGYALVTKHAERTAAVAQTKPASVTVPAAPAAATLVHAKRINGPALAVLPFEDFSPADGGRSLADGLTEAVTAAMARDGRIHVTSRTSAMHVRQTPAPLREIAASLGVDVVVEGSIVRQGRKARVTVQLIDAKTDAHLWAQTYDRDVHDVLKFEAEIGDAITRDLTSVLPRDLQSPTSGATATADAARLPHSSVRSAF